jgi:glycosyltransferase involved in cell wall biosynthesis
MQTSDFLWITSRYEGFGLVAAEAMAARLPIVATRVAGLVDVIEDRSTGILVDLDDCHALAEMTIDLIHDNDLRRQIIGRGYHTATTRFHPRNMSKQYLSLLQQIVKE